MFYLVQTLSNWWLAAAALGLVVGCRARCAQAGPGDETNSGAGSWRALIAFPFLLGLAAAWMQLLPGRAGLALETALLAIAAYLSGCLLGCVVCRLFARARPAPPERPSNLAAPDFGGHVATKVAAASAALVAFGAPKEPFEAPAPQASHDADLAAHAENVSVDAAILTAAAPAPEKVETEPAPSVDLTAHAQEVAGHAAALAAAAPAALAALEAAKTQFAAPAPETEQERAPEPAPSVDLTAHAQEIAGHAAALAAAAPAALAALETAKTQFAAAPKQNRKGRRSPRLPSI